MIGGCCCYNPGDIRLITVGGRETGIAGLLDIFDLWSAKDVSPASLTEEDILSEVKKFNYITASAEAAYIEAVRQEYEEYRKEDGEKSTSS